MEIFVPKWCASYEELYPATQVRICHINITDRYFTSASIYVRDHSIDDVGFGVTGLYVGDLVERWGYPRLAHNGFGLPGFDLCWNYGAYAITIDLGDNKRYSYWLPVTFLVIHPDQERCNL
jgi:hypothetical protein